MQFNCSKHFRTTRSAFALLFVLVLTSLSQSSCSQNNGKNKDVSGATEKHSSDSLIESYKNHLPYELMDKDMVVTDIDFDENSVIYKISVHDNVWKNMSIENNAVAAEKDMARIISYIGKELVQNCIDKGWGIKYVYVSSETRKTLMETEMSSSKLDEICKKMEKGELHAYTMMEMSKIEHKKIEFPYEMSDTEIVTDTYAEGNNIIYIINVNFEIGPDRVASNDKMVTKVLDIFRIRDKSLVFMHKKEIFEEDIHYVFVYKDCRGVEFMRDEIVPAEMFASQEEMKKWVDE